MIITMKVQKRGRHFKIRRLPYYNRVAVNERRDRYFETLQQTSAIAIK